MTQLDLFEGARLEWIAAQLQQLNLKSGDEHYDHAVQAAERGWDATRIRALIWPPVEGAA